MVNKFCLIVKYETGECAYITDKPDLLEALREYTTKLELAHTDQCFKCYSLPEIKEARLVKVYNGSEC